MSSSNERSTAVYKNNDDKGKNMFCLIPRKQVYEGYVLLSDNGSTAVTLASMPSALAAVPLASMQSAFAAVTLASMPSVLAAMALASMPSVLAAMALASALDPDKRALGPGVLALCPHCRDPAVTLASTPSALTGAPSVIAAMTLASQPSLP